MSMTPDDLAMGPITSEDLRARTDAPNRLIEKWLGQFAWPSTATYHAAETGYRAGYAAALAHVTPAEPSTTEGETGRVARMEGFLREIEWMGNSFDAGHRYVHCLFWVGIKGVTGHGKACHLAALLGGGNDGPDK